MKEPESRIEQLLVKYTATTPREQRDEAAFPEWLEHESGGRVSCYRDADGLFTLYDKDSQEYGSLAMRTGRYEAFCRCEYGDRERCPRHARRDV